MSTFTSAPMSPPAPPSRSPSTQRRSRLSFAINYSHPAPPSTSTYQSSNAGRPDPKSPTGASLSTTHRRPPAASFDIMAISVMSNAQQASKPFVAPAHPQSHHLHSLPPREKTTRTLILDHTAWRHGRTRFAQGRCELGMKYRLKGKERNSEAIDVKGKRPGFFIGSSEGARSGFRSFSDFGDPPEVDVASSDEDDEDAGFCESDGEDIRVMPYGKRRRSTSRRRSAAGDDVDMDSDANSSQADSDDHQQLNEIDSEDESIALSLSSRAVGMEKVLHAMLTQPPSTPPRSPSPPPYAMQNSQSHGHQTYFTQPPTSASSATVRGLPNGLRLRLALLTVVNDLFERQPSSAVERPSPTAADNFSRKTPSDSKPSVVSTSPSFSTLPLPSLPTNIFPPGLATFLQISSQPHYTPPTLPSFHTLSLPSSAVAGPVRGFPARSTPPDTIGTSFGGPHGGSPPQAAAQLNRPPPPVFSWKLGSVANPSEAAAAAAAASRGKPAVYSPWGPQSTASASEKPSGFVTHIPSSWKDARFHLSPAAKPKVVLTKRAAGRVKDIYAAGCYEAPVMTNAYRSTTQTFSYRAAPPPLAPRYPVHKLRTLCPRHLKTMCKICDPSIEIRGARSPTRIGAGLLRKQGLLLDRVDQDAAPQLTGSVLADLLPRFLRLSALVAMELGREARGEEPEANEGKEGAQTDAHSSVSPAGSTAKASSHALPTRAWFACLCGLITRGVLEGYMARGWKGSEYVEVLMGIGLGIKGVGTRFDSAGFGNADSLTQAIPVVEDSRNDYEPDEMPGLIDSCRVLFNGLVQDASSTKEVKDKATRDAEEEYVQEMEERLSEFLNIPHNYPDLATHLIQLSEKYPAEPVERAALCFCEAVAKWRGKPELEMYKKCHARADRKSRSSTPTALSIHALLAGSPTPVPHRPPIHKYFNVTVSVSKPPAVRSLKRQRSVDEEIGERKKEKIDTASAMDVEPAAQNLRAESVTSASPRSGSGGAIPDSEWVGPYGV